MNSQKSKKKFPPLLLHLSTLLNISLLLRLSTLLQISLLILPASSQFHFISIGNWGSGNQNQITTASSLKQIARKDHITLLISPGSNFAGGIQNHQDYNWDTSFEDVYSSDDNILKIPFFTVLGTEDWSSNFTAQITKTQLVNTHHSSPIWSTPNFWYHYTTHFTASTGPTLFGSGHQDVALCFTFIDTWILSNSFPVRDINKKAWNDLAATLDAQSKMCDFIIVVADSSIYSSGSTNRHLARHLLPLMKKAKVDAYISGSEFSMEVTEESGIAFINCGSASKGSSTFFSKQSKSTDFYSGEIGFCSHEVTAAEIKTNFIESATGETLYSHSIQSKERETKRKNQGMLSTKLLPPVKYVEVPSLTRMPGREIFIKVVGTIGLCIAFFFGSMALTIGASKATK